MKVSNKVAVVTGAAEGTGKVIALALADLGARVVVADLDGAGADKVAAAIAERGGRSLAVQADVRDERDVDRVMTRAAELGGGPHILVNNAGGWGSAGRQFPDASPAEWGAVLDLNLRAPMLLTQRFLEPMTAAGGGAVINIASIAGHGDGPYGSPEYGAAKAGLIRFTTSLGALHKTTNVRVNCVVPDWIALDRAKVEFAGLSAYERARTPALIPPEAVADAVAAFICNDSLSGRVMVLPGGDAADLLPSGPRTA
jgi:NAD(P)-dependent dehydrogenase (short-subunit alcohol dehydrogenase family)